MHQNSFQLRQTAEHQRATANHTTKENNSEGPFQFLRYDGCCELNVSSRQLVAMGIGTCYRRPLTDTSPRAEPRLLEHETMI
jgi:hypothetical protein